MERLQAICRLTFLLLLHVLAAGDTNGQYSFQQHVNHRLMDMAYSARPAADDELCRSGLRKAEEDIIENEGRYFCIPKGRYFSKARSEDQLIRLLHKEGFEVVWDTVGAKDEPEPNKCYCARLIRYQMERYGKSFRWKMYHTSDSLFVDSVMKNDVAIQTWLCDERSYREVSSEKPVYFYTFSPEDSLCTEIPFVDVGFTVGHHNEITDLYLKKDLRTEEILQPCLERIFNDLQNQLEKDRWRPGKLNGKTVKTMNMVRVYLQEKKDGR